MHGRVHVCACAYMCMCVCVMWVCVCITWVYVYVNSRGQLWCIPVLLSNPLFFETESVLWMSNKFQASACLCSLSTGVSYVGVRDSGFHDFAAMTLPTEPLLQIPFFSFKRGSLSRMARLSMIDLGPSANARCDDYCREWFGGPQMGLHVIANWIVWLAARAHWSVLYRYTVRLC